MAKLRPSTSAHIRWQTINPRLLDLYSPTPEMDNTEPSRPEQELDVGIHYSRALLAEAAETRRGRKVTAL